MNEAKGARTTATSNIPHTGPFFLLRMDVSSLGGMGELNSIYRPHVLQGASDRFFVLAAVPLKKCLLIID
jgi:hypothetical protein